MGERLDGAKSFRPMQRGRPRLLRAHTRLRATRRCPAGWAVAFECLVGDMDGLLLSPTDLSAGSARHGIIRVRGPNLMSLRGQKCFYL